MALLEMRRERGRRAALMTAGLLAVALASPALARPGHGPGHGRNGLDRLERGLSQLGLSAETEEAVAGVLDETRPQLRALHEEIRAAHRAMREQLDADPVDEAALLEQVDAIGALKTEARKAELRAMLRVRELLSPEERAKLQEMREKHRGRKHHHGGQRGGDGGERGGDGSDV